MFQQVLTSLPLSARLEIVLLVHGGLLLALLHLILLVAALHRLCEGWVDLQLVRVHLPEGPAALWTHGSRFWCE